MSVDELDDDEVRNRYATIVDRIPSYEERKETYQEELQNDDEVVDTAKKEVDASIRSNAKHDNLLTSTISAFLPGGSIQQETGWTFRGAEPLSEYNEPNADAIFCNPDRNIALVVECKTSLSSPGGALTQIYDAAEAVRDYKDELSANIGMKIDHLETAICVPSYLDEQIAHRIEEEERNGEAEERVYVWRLHYLKEGERLDLFTGFNNRTKSEATHDSELSQVLNSGIEITKERQATPSFFPSSHTFHIMEASFSQILKRRVQNEGPLREFTDAELRDILTSQRHLPHYNAEDIGDRIFNGLIDRLETGNLITSIDSEDTELTGGDEYYRFRVRGRSIETVLKNLQEKYREEAVGEKLEIKAMRKVIEEFDDDQSSLGDFG
jgi:hypothetical protein